MSKTNLKKLIGTAVPLGALYTKDSPAIGEFSSLGIFARFAKEAGLGIIQLLPLNDSGTQSSPYSALSAFALHPIYLTLKDIEGFSALYDAGGHFKAEYDKFIKHHKYSNRYNYQSILNSKNMLLRLLYENTETGKTGKASEELYKWIKKNPWIVTYSVYKQLKWKYMQSSWKSWPAHDSALSEEQINARWKDKAFLRDHLFYAWEQMECERQLLKSVDEAKKLGILIKGDLPILMNEDSCDAWAHPEIFNQSLRAGSPADGENPTGQNWGFPTYNWKNLKAQDYAWWKDRLANSAKFYDAYRLDHILGFFRIWAIPENDANALNGHTEPFVAITSNELYELGFDDDRIRWLSVPHVPTHPIEDITWNHEAAHKILEKFATKLPDEELWLLDGGKTAQEMKKSASPFGSKNIWDADLSELCTEDAAGRIKSYLADRWTDRTLISLGKNKFVASWIYSKSTSWQSLNDAEKEKLSKLFAEKSEKENKLWEKSATEILSALTSSTKMVPCGEDLGVSFECVGRVMKNLDILGLRVVRWCREWEKQVQPYVPFENYDSLSVCTTSVHDSSTMRSWVQDELRIAKENPQTQEEKDNPGEKSLSYCSSVWKDEAEFTPELARKVLIASAKARSLWFIPPLQDLLYMNKKYWLPDDKDERINVPGSVTDFNWTYRVPASVEELLKDKSLIADVNGLG